MKGSAIGSNNNITKVISSNSPINDDIESALVTISDFVEKSENKAAQLLLKEFKEKLNSREENKSRLQQYWDALKATLPDIAKLTDACAKISSLFIL